MHQGRGGCLSTRVRGALAEKVRLALRWGVRMLGGWVPGKGHGQARGRGGSHLWGHCLNGPLLTRPTVYQAMSQHRQGPGIQ